MLDALYDMSLRTDSCQPRNVNTHDQTVEVEDHASRVEVVVVLQHPDQEQRQKEVDQLAFVQNSAKDQDQEVLPLVVLRPEKPC